MGQAGLTAAALVLALLHLAGASEGRVRNRGQSQECALNGPLLPGIIPPPSNTLVCSRITEYDGGISSTKWETRKTLIHRSGRDPT